MPGCSVMMKKVMDAARDPTDISKKRLSEDNKQLNDMRRGKRKNY